MSRITTSYYGADPTTQFAWATTGSDQFSRTQDLYYLAQAVELHDHTSGRGLPVGRIADGSITTAAIAPLSVTANELANLTITGAKIAASTITIDKFAMPLREATSNAAGGMQLRDASNAYTSYWWTSANGYGVFSATGTPAFMINQSNQVVVGSSYPSSPGLFTIHQINVSDGMLIAHPGSTNWRAGLYHDGLNQFWITTPATSVIWSDVSSFIYPASDNTHGLGHPSFRWNNIYSINAAIGTVAATTISMSTLSGTSISITGSLIVGGNITGPPQITTSLLATTSLTTSTISASAAITAGSFVTSGGVTAASVAATGAVTAATVTASGALSSASLDAHAGLIHGGSVNSDTTGYFGTTLAVAYGLTPPWNITLGTGDAGKPGGGAWQAVSDPRSKYKDSIRPYTAGLALALQLDPIWFRYNGKYGMADDGREYVGFDASELQKIAPNMVRTISAHEDPAKMLELMSNPDVSIDTLPEPHVILSVDPSELPFIAIRAIQELAGTVKELLERVAKLEAKPTPRRARPTKS